MSSDRCECGFYNRDRHHTKIGGGECDFIAYRKRIAELEQQLAGYKMGAKAEADAGDDARAELAALQAHSELLREAADMTILKHRIRMEKGSLVWFDMPSEEMEKLGALLQESEK